MITELSEKVRHECYNQALQNLTHYASQNETAGICDELYDALTERITGPFDSIVNLFPEFAAHKPKPTLHKWDYWWTMDEVGMQIRIEVLQSCVNQTAP